MQRLLQRQIYIFYFLLCLHNQKTLNYIPNDLLQYHYLTFWVVTDSINRFRLSNMSSYFLSKIAICGPKTYIFRPVCEAVTCVLCEWSAIIDKVGVRQVRLQIRNDWEGGQSCSLQSFTSFEHLFNCFVKYSNFSLIRKMSSKLCGSQKQTWIKEILLV